ncbi:MAG: SEL1-like repeat protein [Lentisphaerae bacterium]|nr:SEL1-like repeat protein [Lentisphaerota bacterium]
MKKYNTLLSGVLCSSILLTGCVLNDQPEAITVPKKQVQNPEELRKNEMDLAKFMYKNSSTRKAFEIFSKYADQGNPEALAWLGRCYVHGVGTKVEYDKAYEYFSKAADQNNPWGIYGLGYCKKNGYGTDLNLSAALSYYKKAADMGLPHAVLELAITYSLQESGHCDLPRAEEYYKKAISLNADRALESYALFLLLQKRYKEAISILLRKEDDAGSFFILALCYENGWGVETDIKKALSLREKAYHLGERDYEDGSSFYIAGLEEKLINGITDHARYCFKMGAKLGHKESSYEYAIIMQDSKLEKEALEYMCRAADKGYDKALIEAGKMLKNSKPDKAAEYFMSATLSQRTESLAVSHLAELYKNVKDPKRRDHWNQYGLSIGNAYCRNELAISKLNNSNNDNDWAQAIAWFALSMIDNNEFGNNQFYQAIEKSYNRLRMLADKGNGNALFSLGVLGCLNKKEHPNVKIGIELLEKAAANKNEYACYILGNIYFNGELLKKDNVKALAWYKKGAELGHGKSALSVVTLLYYNKEFQKTPEKDVINAFEKCIELGEFSRLFEYGLYVKSPEKSLELLRKAADKGDTRAMLRLYDILLEKDRAAADDYLTKAVEMEDGEAELRKGKASEIPRDAFSMYLRAWIHNDSLEASECLADCWLNGRGCDVNLGMFWKAANSAYKKGSHNICLIMGDVYREGKIIPKDLKKAKEYYSEGAKRGNKKCREQLDKMK